LAFEPAEYKDHQAGEGPKLLAYSQRRIQYDTTELEGCLIFTLDPPYEFGELKVEHFANPTSLSPSQRNHVVWAEDTHTQNAILTMNFAELLLMYWRSRSQKDEKARSASACGQPSLPVNNADRGC